MVPVQTVTAGFCVCVYVCVCVRVCVCEDSLVNGGAHWQLLDYSNIQQ